MYPSWRTGPIPAKWRDVLGVGADVPRPSSWAVALAADGLWLRAVVWGDGGREPYIVQVYALHEPDRRELAPHATWKPSPALRWPTLPELTSVQRGEPPLGVLPPGAILQLPPLTGAIPEPTGTTLTCQLAQIGAVSGTKAGTRWELARARNIILSPGGHA